MPRPNSATAFRHRPHTPPLEAQEINPGSNLQVQMRVRQVELLRKAEAGDEEAKAKLRARGLVRWVKEGKVIV